MSPARSCASAKSSSKPHRLGFRHPRQQLLDPHLDGNLFGRQQHARPVLRALDDRLKRVQQAEEIDLELRLVVVARDVGHALVGPQPLRRAQLLALVQQSRGGLELLMLEQPPHQRVARIFFFALDARRRLRAWAAASST